MRQNRYLRRADARKLAAMRRATTAAESRYGIGGVAKQGHHVPKPVTLAPLPWDDVKPHFYSPDGQAMGDCRICGHGRAAGWHR